MKLAIFVLTLIAVLVSVNGDGLLLDRLPDERPEQWRVAHQGQPQVRDDVQ